MGNECFECDKPFTEYDSKFMRWSNMGNSIWLCYYCNRITPTYMGESRPGIARSNP